MAAAIAEYLSAGGNVGTLGLFLYVMRQQILQDRRILRLEIKTGNEPPAEPA